MKDRFAFSWQVVPTVMGRLMSDPNRGRSSRVVQALLKMKKLDIAALERAHAG
jgi:predicted 3-demethylubiquinone-9 3-methyltransferase (glyoxalase superfamily)